MQFKFLLVFYFDFHTPTRHENHCRIVIRLLVVFENASNIVWWVIKNSILNFKWNQVTKKIRHYPLGAVFVKSENMQHINHFAVKALITCKKTCQNLSSAVFVIMKQGLNVI